jgi:hypothetical protein
MAKSMFVAFWFLALATPLAGQWLNLPTPGVPRLPDGKPNLSAPAPRGPDGKPDLSGIWRPNPKFNNNLAADLKPGDVPLLPAAAAVLQERRDTLGKDDPQARCLPPGVPRQSAVPFPFRIIQQPGLIAILYEYGTIYRQIFTDGRELPKDPNPTWMGYSIGRWEGDTLVVETIGFNGRTWLDDLGHPISDKLRVVERFQRQDFGNMDVGVTIDDPPTYSRPWSMTMDLRLAADTELLEFICNENNKDPEHLIGK